MKQAHYAGRWALVTGASSGIGRALSLELARRGAKVVLAARRTDKLREVEDEIRREGGEARVLRVDVAETDEAVRAFREIDAELGGIDLVVANAGVGESRGQGESYAWESIKDALHTNFCGAAGTLTALLPRMIERGSGHLVGIGSLASYGALPGALAYSAPKAGLAMVLDCLRLDTTGTGVAVTHVELGFVRTPMVARSTHPMPQLMSAEKAARVIVDALPRKPRTITYPRALALLTRCLAALPAPVREAIARKLRD